jgi:hypothetical protein
MLEVIIFSAVRRGKMRNGDKGGTGMFWEFQEGET